MQKVLQCPDGHVCECTPSQLLTVAAQIVEHLHEIFDAIPAIITPPREPVERLRWFLDSEHSLSLTPAMRVGLRTIARGNGEASICELTECGVFALPRGMHCPTDGAINNFRTRTNRVLVEHGLQVSISGRSHIAKIISDNQSPNQSDSLD